MADGKLIFPIKFDLDSAVKNATGDIDAIMKKLGTMVSSKPLQIRLAFDDTSSNIAINKRLKELEDAWSKMSNFNKHLPSMSKYTDETFKNFSPRAQQMIQEYAQLTGAVRTHNKSLAELQKEADKAANAEMKLNEKAQQRAAVLGAEEKSLKQVGDKIKLLTQLMKEFEKGSDAWNKLSLALERVKQKEKELQAVQKAELAQIQGEYNAVKSLVTALQGYGNTIGQIQAKLNAFKATVNNTKIGGAAFREASLQIKMMNEELNKANQMVKNYQEKAFEGVGKKNTDARVREMEALQSRIRQIDSDLNRMNVKGQIVDKGGNVSIQANRLLQERINLENQLKDIVSTGAAAVKKKLEEELAAQQKLIDAAGQRADAYNKKRQLEAEELAQSQQKAKEEARVRQESQQKELQANEARKRILNEQKLSYDSLMQKVQMLEKARNRTDIGAARWQRLTNEINKAKESLRVVTTEMNKAAQAQERMSRLREIFSMSERTMAGLSARLAEYNAQLQNQEIGSRAFENTATKVAKLTLELQKATQYAQDFAQKAFQGLGATDTTKRVNELQHWRRELQRIEEDYNKLRTIQLSSGLNSSQERAVLDLIQQRKNVVDNIKQSTMTLEQAALEYEKKQTEEKRKQQALIDKQKGKSERRSLIQSESKDMDTLLKKLQYFQDRLNKIDATKRPKTFEQYAKEIERLTKLLDKAKRKMAEMTGQSSSKQAADARKVNQEYSKQLTYVDRLIRRMAVYGSISMVGDFLSKVREVTAQFELQRVSLGAILQNQNKANQLFSEIKSFALKSPVSILDLTKYTKQLAAYKIGYDELFETTKKLTDVSVGLGVSMDRVVLAYGQVRATGHLRASEIRQFTEMGVPIVEELAAKLTKLNHQTVTAADVMDMVSKRAISFQMVKEVFDDMTESGGIFYNMQEKQGNTLYGLWAKLGDAASVMYAEIGNVGLINDSMKSIIGTLTSLMKNWRLVGAEIASLVIGYGAFKLIQSLVTYNTIAAAKATRDYARAQMQLNAIQRQGGLVGQEAAARLTMRAAAAYRAAAMSTNILTAAQFRLVGALNQVKAFFAANWISLVITGVMMAASAFAAWIEKTTRLGRELEKLKNETATLQGQQIRNFEYLAEKALTSIDGSKRQKDALDELNRTYGEMLPQEALKIENLRKMKGNYDELTQAIRENVAAQQSEKMRNAIEEDANSRIVTLQKLVRLQLSKGLKLSDPEIDRFFLALEQKIRKTGEFTVDTIRQINEELNLGLSESDINDLGRASKWGDPNQIEKIANEYLGLEERLKGVAEWEQIACEELGRYTKEMQAFLNTSQNSTLDGSGSFPAAQQNLTGQLTLMASNIEKAMTEAGLKFEEGWVDIVAVIDKNDLGKVTTIQFDKIIQAIDPKAHPELRKYIEQYKRIYEDLVPSDPVAQQIRQKFFEIAKSTGANIELMRNYLWDGKMALTDHIKTLAEQIDRYEAEIYRMNAAIAKGGVTGMLAQMIFGDKIKEYTDVVKSLNELMKFEKTYIRPEKKKEKKPKKGRTSTPQDTRLQELQEIVQTLEKINKEYNDLEKREGNVKATEDIKSTFKDTLDYINKLGKRFKLNFDFPLDFDTLQDYKKEILKVMKSLNALPKPKSEEDKDESDKDKKDKKKTSKKGNKTKNVLKGKEKAILELQTSIDSAEVDNLEKQLEAALKRVQERIAKTKVAKEFFDKILNQTGNIEVATKIAFAVYPETGKDLYTNLQDEIRRLFTSGDAEWDNINILPNLDKFVFDDENERINYRNLEMLYAQLQNYIIEKNRDTLDKLIANGQKEAAEQILTWEKELAKAKSFEEKRTDIINQEAQRRAEIYKSHLPQDEPQDEKDNLVNLSYEKQNRALDDLRFEEFTKSDDYIKIFENLENVSTPALKRLKAQMEEIIKTNQNLSPENMKTLVKAMEDIENQISGRGFGNDMINSVREYFGAVKDLKTAKADLQKAQEKYKMKEKEINASIQSAIDEEIAAWRNLDALKKDANASQNDIVSAELRLNTAVANVARAEEKKANAVKKVKDAEQKVTDQQDKQRKATQKFFNDLGKVADTADKLASTLGEVKDLLGIADESAEGVVFDSAIQGLQQFAQSMQLLISLQELYNIVTSSNPWIAIAAAVLAVGSILGNWIANEKVRKANKEIERQQEILDRLEYTYGRLEQAAEKAFGADIVRNYNEQLNNLNNQVLAKQRQLEAEKSKGKKKDKEKIKSYENEIRDLKDEIVDLYGTISQRMLGTDITSAARNFAQAWLEAYKEFGNTADAMTEKFKEMIENMVVEGALAKVIERALRPMFDMIDNMSDEDFYNPNFWKKVVEEAERGANAANYGGGVVMSFLEQAGISIRSLGGELTGITRDIASASEESINGLAAGINTQNFYFAQQLEEVRGIKQILLERQNMTGVSSTLDYTELQNTALDHLAAIERHTAETVSECRNIATRCEEQTNLMRRVIGTKGGAQGINVMIKDWGRQ